MDYEQYEKTCATSLKKFYKCMSGHGFVSLNDYEASAISEAYDETIL